MRNRECGSFHCLPVSRLNLLLGLAIGWLSSSSAQNTADEDLRIRVSANLVQVDATVTGPGGEHVGDLTKDDFEVLLDGKPQAITHFAYMNRADQPVAVRAAPQVRPQEERDGLSRAHPSMPTVGLKPEQVDRTVVFFVDDLSLSAESVPFIRKGLRDVIDNYLGPGDLTAIVRASAGMGALQDFTADKRLLLSAAAQVRWSPLGRGEASAYKAVTAGPPPNERDEDFRIRVFTIAVTDSLRRIIESLADLPGRKAAIVFSDSLPLATRQTMDGHAKTVSSHDYGDSILDRMRRCADAAARSAVVIYAVDTRGLATLQAAASDNLDHPGRFTLPVSGQPLGQNTSAGIHGTEAATNPGDFVWAATSDRRDAHDEGQAGAAYLAGLTGGFLVPESNDVGHSIRRIYSDLNGYYLLGFQPPESAFEPSAQGLIEFRRIEVRVKRAGLHVRSHSGFLGKKEPDLIPAGTGAQLQLASALESPFGASGIGLEMHSSFLGAKGHELFVMSTLAVHTSDLSLSGPLTNRSATIHLVLRAFSVGGAQMEGGIDKLLRVSLNEEGYERAFKYGLVYSTTIPIPSAGPYQIRAALLDVASGKTGTANEFVSVPKTGGRQLALSGIVFPAWLTKEDDITPAERSMAFSRGETIAFAFEIFGRIDKARLTARAQLFRDGLRFEQGEDVPIEVQNRTVTKRLFARSKLVIPAAAEPGDYLLQVVITDRGNAGSPRMAWQWVWLRVE